MAIGYSVGTTCFASQSDALDAFYSAVQPIQFLTNYLGSTAAFQNVTFVKTAGVWYRSENQSTSANTTILNARTFVAPTNVLGSCSLINDPATNFADGMTLGWGVAGAMIIVYVIRRVFR